MFPCHEKNIMAKSQYLNIWSGGYGYGPSKLLKINKSLDDRVDKKK